MSQLILLRHGRSDWNERNLFTGWYDCGLIESGRSEASASGPMITGAGLVPQVVHTSLQVRAVDTANLCLAAMNLGWLPVRRHWRLNERHYGDLTGLNKAETTAKYGADQVKIWRRSYDVPPPPITSDNPSNPNADPRYSDLPPEAVPLTECLADVVHRVLPYWVDSIIPDLQRYGTVLVAAHGNSLRALVKHLDGISDEDISELNIPTGIPLRYELNHDMRPAHEMPTIERYLGDTATASAAAAAVAAQAG